ncbi:protein FAM220A [Manis pentadactyla]|uniref:protein FAM220A n=1 Tax=Manis pentadactyla TaxID=143292 RepID=UPI00255CA7CC|nr:protein FAM220A [Manis pentadactyla]
MRSGGVALDTRLAKAKGVVAELSHRLKKTREANPCLMDVPFWVHKPAGDANGNSQSKELSLEMKNDLNEANLMLHHGDKMHPYLKESLRNSASVAAQSKTVDLFFAPAEEHFAGVSRGVGKAPARDWLGGGPRAADSHRGQYCKGEPLGSGLPRWQKRSEIGISEEQAPSVFLKGLGSELKLSCLCSDLSILLHAHPEVLPNDETRCVFLGHSKPMFSEQIEEYKKMLSRVKSTSNHLQITPGLLALQAFEVAAPLCHS